MKTTITTTSTTTVDSSKEMFIYADEVSKTLGVSRAYAYRIIKQFNLELSEKGYMTIEGRTSRKFFDEKFYRKVF